LARGQSPLAFEVASVKPGKGMSGGMIRIGMSGGPGSADPGTITVENYPLRQLIQRAYNVKPYQLNGPDWLGDTYFDIVAKVPAGTTADQVLEMWRTLLAERFHLKVHRESKELPVYALVVNKGGPKMEEAPPDDAVPAPSMSGSGRGAPVPTGGGGGSAAVSFGRAGFNPGGAGMSTMRSDHMPMSNLADSLSRNVDRPVIDETGLKGRYKVSLQWSRDELTPGAGADGSPAPNIFHALQDQLGLKLEPKKAPVEFVVVDAVEKTPVEN
jgi:uncharacterized protein (TIGR03435 family)